MPPSTTPSYYQDSLLAGYTNEEPIKIRRSPRNHPEQASCKRWKGRNYAYRGRYTVLVIYKGKLYDAPRVKESYYESVDNPNKRLQG